MVQDEERGVRVRHRAGRPRHAIDERQVAEDVAGGQARQLDASARLHALVDVDLARREQEERVARAAFLVHDRARRNLADGERGGELREARLRQVTEELDRSELVDSRPPVHVSALPAARQRAPTGAPAGSPASFRTTPGSWALESPTSASTRPDLMAAASDLSIEIMPCWAPVSMAL